jgi:hypothetical protein
MKIQNPKFKIIEGLIHTLFLTSNISWALKHGIVFLTVMM